MWIASMAAIATEGIPMKSLPSALVLAWAVACAPAWSAEHAVDKDKNMADCEMHRMDLSGQDAHVQPQGLAEIGAINRDELAGHHEEVRRRQGLKKTGLIGAKRDSRSLPMSRSEATPWNFE
jgi:hypothetical protein